MTVARRSAAVAKAVVFILIRGAVVTEVSYPFGWYRLAQLGIVNVERTNTWREMIDLCRPQVLLSLSSDALEK